MEIEIKNLSEIDYNSAPLVNFYATIISIENEGNAESKRPIKFVAKLEESGESIQLSTWKYDLLDLLKAGVTNIMVYKIKGSAGNFGNYGNQVRVGEITPAGYNSTKKVLSVVDVNTLKLEISKLVKDYIPKTSLYYGLLEKLVLNNDKFFTWPAATKLHHAYPSGLAKHSLGVCKTALAIWKAYQGENCRVDALVAGALLHDIGKLSEYKSDGERTIYGDLIPHSIDGYQKILSAAISLGCNPENDMDFIILAHIILSHHGKLEFGAPVLPNILEAQIIHKADELDAINEAENAFLNNAQLYELSQNLKVTNGSKCFKWHN